MGLEAVLVAIAGYIGSFVSTLVSNGSSVTLPALELFGLSEHVANGTNRLSVVALGLVGTVSFAREGLIDWRTGRVDSRPDSPGHHRWLARRHPA
jgi:uncharacterized membrane protein YfcA